MNTYYDKENDEKFFQVGENIRKYRKLRGLTQKQLGEDINLSDSAIRNYELGNRIPDYYTVLDIAAVLNVDSSLLFEPNINNISSVAKILVQLEALYGLHPKMIDGDVHLVFTGPDEDIDTVPQDRKYILKQELLYWCKARDAYKSGYASEADYEDWKISPGYEEDGNPLTQLDPYPLLLDDAISFESARRRGGYPPLPVYDENHVNIMPYPPKPNKSETEDSNKKNTNVPKRKRKNK